MIININSLSRQSGGRQNTNVQTCSFTQIEYILVEIGHRYNRVYKMQRLHILRSN